LKIKAYKRFQKAYKRLPKEVQKKIDKQIKLLSKDFKHPTFQYSITPPLHVCGEIKNYKETLLPQIIIE